MKKIRLIGSTGLVDSVVLRQALINSDVKNRVILARHPLSDQNVQYIGDISANFDRVPLGKPLINLA